MPIVRKLREKKTARQSLLTLYGINRITAEKIIGLLSLHPRAKYKNLLRNRDFFYFLLVGLKVEYKLRAHVMARILLLLIYYTYRGLRHAQKLPTRGQRTHANAKTQQRLALAGKALPFKLIARNFKQVEKGKKKTNPNTKNIKKPLKKKK